MLLTFPPGPCFAAPGCALRAVIEATSCCSVVPPPCYARHARCRGVDVGWRTADVHCFTSGGSFMRMRGRAESRARWCHTTPVEPGNRSHRSHDGGDGHMMMVMVT